VFDFAKEVFDQVAVFVECGVKGAPTCGCDSAWNDGFRSCCRDGVHSALAVMALVGQNMACCQALNLVDVIAFPARDILGW
jgi:hypothetical protein